MPPTWEEDASEQYCSCYWAHPSPLDYPCSFPIPHLGLAYHHSLLNAFTQPVVYFTMCCFYYYLLISCVCVLSLRRLDAPQNNSFLLHILFSSRDGRHSLNITNLHRLHWNMSGLWVCKWNPHVHICISNMDRFFRISNWNELT